MRVVVGTLLVCLVLGFSLASRTPAPAGAMADASAVERGRYLALRVAMCVECHTPRDRTGNLDQSRLLLGAPIPLLSPFPNRPWAFQAPAIGGLPGWTEPEVVHLLTRGERMGGQVPRGPMPRFGMTAEDAGAVAAYLMSLR